MKNLLTVFVLVQFINANAQKLHVDPTTMLVTYESIVSVDSMKADQIFDRTKGWFVEYFRDAKDVIRGEVKPELIKGTFIATYDVSSYKSDIVVRIKDGKLKIVIDHFMDAKPNPAAGSVLTIESWGVKSDKITLRSSMEKQFIAIETGCSSMIDNLQSYLRKKSDF